MENNPKQVDVCNEKFKTIFNQLEKLETNINNIHELSTSVSNIAISVNNICEVLKTHEKKIRTLENEKGRLWDEIVKNIIASVIGIVVGYFVAKIK